MNIVESGLDENNKLRISVCTLFEGIYHFGLAALVNSLYRNGYRGIVYAGFRGDLPPWVPKDKAQVPSAEEFIFEVAPDLRIYFIRLTTTSHLTFFKARFVLDIIESYCAGTNDAVAYFDSDIMLKSRWSFYEEWISKGRISVCEDARSPVYSSGPQKSIWVRFLKAHGYKIHSTTDGYFNAGFVAIASSGKQFLLDWIEIMEKLGPIIGDKKSMLVGDPAFAFALPDQDAFNMALMISPDSTSPLNKSAMGFEPGGFVMVHAIGRLKPWREGMLMDAFAGKIPMVLESDKEYLNNVCYPIRLYNSVELFLRKIERWFSTLFCKMRR